ncbi:Prefoldin subunit 6 [Podospora pseudopauciseta]|uniref:Prefoldin subunit 6 n=1 Tax=Podospora pseudopauciseta TaxID=2093780 RepID=A0ABR0H7V1_9PEZI|nr:Prefoldin subunit 6 [Podospora pseudopauciseta]
MADIQRRLQALSEDYAKLQKDLQDTVTSRQKLEAQMQENLGVQQVRVPPWRSARMTLTTEQEFEKLKDGETIYKLIGPVLLKQDRTDAESTVKGRLEFIEKEITRLEGHIKETQAKMEKKKTEIIQVQTSAQAAVGAGPQAVKGRA